MTTGQFATPRPGACMPPVAVRWMSVHPGPPEPENLRDRVIQESYNLLHIQTFFTVGDDEVRAWPHTIGSTAQQAAGKIHTDLERGFIRAEIVPWDVLLELGGMPEARQAGKLRLEGKNYLIQDGEVMVVRFNV